MSTSIVSGFTQQYFHSLPSDLDLIKTSPRREAIFKYLSQISYDDFPEFILDILTKIEGHMPVDITDGPGDEKQDILTIDSEGRRCLTQCKHKEDADAKYSGDELDRVVAACLRKNCRVATFVTNGDLSPQAKGYITDKEFLRGWPDKDNPLSVDYWNGAKIWDKIKNNNDILHKWFSGMAQSHGLRVFRFEASLLKMPFSTHSAIYNAEHLVAFLKSKGLIKDSSKEDEYEGVINGNINFKLKLWFQIRGKLRLKQNMPKTDAGFWSQPLDALSIEVILPENIEKYSPSEIKANLIEHLFSAMTVEDEAKEWIYILASQARSFTFLHDISEPRELELDGARSFVIRGGKAIPEYGYCDLESPNYKVKPNSEDEESIFIHADSGCECVQFFEQSLSPVETYNYQRQQLSQLPILATYEFRAVEGLDYSDAMRIRRILDPEWVAFIDSRKVFIWCFPPDTKASKVEFIEKKLKVLGIKVLHVREEDRQIILSDMSKDVPPVELVTITELPDASTPIVLDHRGYWIFKDLQLAKPLDFEGAIELTKYKFGYEHEHGFDNMQGKTKLKSHTSELPNMLCDIYSIRCDSMIDIAIQRNPIIVNLRYFPRELGSSIELANKALAEFQKIFDEVKRILADYSA